MIAFLTGTISAKLLVAHRDAREEALLEEGEQRLPPTTDICGGLDDNVVIQWIIKAYLSADSEIICSTS